jgi:hypothetical protein
MLGVRSSSIAMSGRCRSAGIPRPLLAWFGERYFPRTAKHLRMHAHKYGHDHLQFGASCARLGNANVTASCGIEKSRFQSMHCQF